MNKFTFPSLSTQAGDASGTGLSTSPSYNLPSSRDLPKLPQAYVHFKAALQQALPGENSDSLKERLGVGLYRQLEDLSQEEDLDIFYQDLLHLGRTALRQKNPQVAAFIFQSLAEGKDFSGLIIPPTIRSKASLEWDGMQGKGGLGLRLENAGRNFVDQVFAPGPLLAMGLAAPVFSLTRYRTMAHLISKPAGLWTRGMGLRLASSSAGLLPEVATFWGVNRAYNQITHPELNNWATGAMLQELAGLTMTFGLFKLNGRLFRTLADDYIQYRVARGTVSSMAINPSTLRGAAGGLGMYSGIVSSHAIEAKLGWRPPGSLDHIFTESLVTYVQLKSMGHLSHRLMGNKYAAWMQSLEHKAETLEAPKFWDGDGSLPQMLDSLKSLLSPGLVLVTPEGIPIRIGQGPGRVEAKDLAILMTAKDGDGSKTAPSKPKASLDSFHNNIIKNLLQIYQDKSSSQCTRLKMAAELYQNLDLTQEHLRSVLDFKVRQHLEDGKELQREVGSILNKHLETLFLGGGERQVELVLEQIAKAYQKTGEKIPFRSKQKIKGELTGITKGSAQRTEMNPGEIEGVARSVLNLIKKAQREDHGRIQKEGSEKIRETLIIIRLNHFQTVSDKIFVEGKKFSYLVQSLREMSAKSPTGEEKEIYEHLLSSVEIKQSEIARVHAESESFIADFRGTKKKSKFTRKDYPEFLEGYEKFLIRIDKYIHKYPQLSKLVDTWDGKDIHQRSEGLLAEDLSPLVKKLEISEPDRKMFLSILPHDPVLKLHQYIPLHRILRSLDRGVDMDQFPELWNPISRYIRAVRGLDPWTVPEDFARLNPQLGIGEVEQETALRNWESLLKLEISERVGTDKEHAGTAIKSVEDYIGEASNLLAHLRQHRPQLRVLPPPEWEVIRERLLDRSKKGFLSESSVKKLFEWSEGTAERAPNPIMNSHKNVFVEGMVEFLLNESREPAQLKTLTRFIEEICERDDIDMMTQLAIRFHNYRYGVAGAERTDGTVGFSSVGGKINGDRHQLFLESLLATAQFYQEHPNFKGAYFELLEKYQPGSRQQNSLLVSPIHQKAKDLLIGSSRVELISRATMGTAVFKVQPTVGSQYLVGVTSVQGKLADRAQFFTWSERLLEDFQAVLSDGQHGPGRLPVEFSIQIPRMASEYIRHDVLNWARDFLDLHPEIDRFEILVPKHQNAARDRYNSDEFGALLVDRKMTTTEENIRILTTELRERPQDLGVHISLYRYLKSLYPQVGLDSPAFEHLLKTRKKFPLNSTVQKEINQVLRANMDYLEDIGESRLSDFTRDHHVFNIRQRHRQAKYNHYKKNGNGHGLVGPPVGRLSEAQSTLNTPQHFSRIHKVIEAVLGQTVPRVNFAEYLDLSPVGFQFRDLKLKWDPHKPLGFSIEGWIHPINGEFPFGRGEIPLISERDNPMAAIGEGFFEVQITRQTNSRNLELLVPSFRMPANLQGNGVGTYLLNKLMDYGQQINARQLRFLAVPTPGKFALLKMGGRITDKIAWHQVRQDFQSYVSNYLTEQDLWGYDKTSAGPIRNPQQLVNAFLDPGAKILDLRPEFMRMGEGAQLVYQDPQITEKYDVGRQYFIQGRFWDWEIQFDLRPESPQLDYFKQYYAHRFGLPLGESLKKPGNNKDESSH